METVIQGSTLQTLRAGLRGTAHAPGEEGYEETSRAWNLAAHQTPALVVVARGAADVMAAVRFAREGGLGVGVMATGHGVGAACDGGSNRNIAPSKAERSKANNVLWASSRRVAVLHRTLWNKRLQHEIL